jgi:hypothetical protein
MHSKKNDNIVTFNIGSPSFLVFSLGFPLYISQGDFFLAIDFYRVYLPLYEVFCIHCNGTTHCIGYQTLSLSVLFKKKMLSQLVMCIIQEYCTRENVHVNNTDEFKMQITLFLILKGPCFKFVHVLVMHNKQ